MPERLEAGGDRRKRSELVRFLADHPWPTAAARASAALLRIALHFAVVLQSLEVRHVLGFAEPQTLEFSAPAEGKGQWIALVGPNGAGKTTLLRCLVLALRDLSNPKIWPKGTLDEAAYRRQRPRHLNMRREEAAYS